MKLQQIPNEQAHLIAPLQDHGQFAANDPNFWNKAKGRSGYKIYLLRRLYIDIGDSYQDLFLVDTGATTCVFKGVLMRD